MPLFVRKLVDHYPDDDPPLGTADTDHVVLTGNLVAGTISCTPHGPSEGDWRWGVGIGGLLANGRGATMEACKHPLGRAFRQLLGRAGLAERADAKAGPPVRAQPPPALLPGVTWSPPPPIDDAAHPVAIHQPRRFTVHSGELLVGLINEADRVPWVGQWHWAISGGTWPRDPDFVWQGHARSLEDARAEHAAAWAEFLAWAGLEQAEPLRWRSA